MNAPWVIQMCFQVQQLLIYEKVSLSFNSGNSEFKPVLPLKSCVAELKLFDHSETQSFCPRQMPSLIELE